MIEKVAFFRFSSTISALEQYRVFGPLTKAGIQILEGIKDSCVDQEVIRESDLVLFQRDFSSHFDWYKTVVNHARESGKPIILDLDDDLFALPSDHPDRISTYYASGLPALLHAILNVDGITVTTQPLKETVQNLNPNVWVLPNYFDDQLWDFNPQKPKFHGEPVTIFYMGTETHRPDLASISKPLFQLADFFGPAIKFYFYGIEPPSGLEELTQVTHQPVQTFNYEMFVSCMSQIQADIAIAPLCDNAFNRSKSAIKFFEYTAMGIPSVYADLPPYSSIIRDGYNGLLAQTPDQWYEKIRLLIEKPELRQMIIQNAQESIKTQWLMSNHSSEWLETYNKIDNFVRMAQVDRDHILDSLEMVVTQQKEIRDRQELINSLNDKISTQSSQLGVLEAETTSLETEKAALEAKMTSLETDKAALEDKMTSLETEKAALEAEKTSLEEIIFDLQHKLEDKEHQIDELENTISKILLSKSWRITRPFRKLFWRSKGRLD